MTLGDVVEVIGRFTEASNATLLGVTADGTRVVYKPVAGVRPLWDFAAETLEVREVLTYEVDRAMGLGLVPETVSGDGPYGRGAIQRYVEERDGFDPLPLAQRGDDRLWPFAVLDLVTNNADRKLGHIIDGGATLVAVDHGLTFHPDDKLRTVLWAFAGRRIPDRLVSAIDGLATALRRGLCEEIERTLGPEEAAAIGRRVERLLAEPFHPAPPDDRPALPWPPY